MPYLSGRELLSVSPTLRYTVVNAAGIGQKLFK